MKNRYFIILRQTFKSLNWFETVLLLAILSLAVMSFFIKGDFGTNAIIAAVAAILGVFCVVLGAKGSLANWIFGVVEAFLHIYICFCTHIYGDMLQRLFYNLPMQFIGFNMWKKRTRHDGTATIRTRYMTWRQRWDHCGIGSHRHHSIGSLPHLFRTMDDWCPHRNLARYGVQDPQDGL